MLQVAIGGVAAVAAGLILFHFAAKVGWRWLCNGVSNK
jgi:hypothetical protein